MRKRNSVIFRLGAIFSSVGVAIFIILSIIFANQLIRKNKMHVEEKFYNQALRLQNEIETKFNNWYIAAERFSKIITATQRNIDSLPIEYTDFDALLRPLLSDFDDVMSVKLVLEPGFFYKLDSSLEQGLYFDSYLRYAIKLKKDPMGRIQTVALRNYDTEGLGDFYLWPRKHQEAYITPPVKIVEEHSDYLVSDLSIPLIIDNKFAGVLAVELSLEWLQTLTEQKLHSGNGALMAIYSAEGKILARSFESYRRGDNLSNIYNDKLRKLLEIKSGRKQISHYADYMEFAVPIKLVNGQINWQLALNVSQDEVSDASSKILRNIFGIMIIVIFFSLFITIYAVNRVMQPLESLHENAARIADGNLKINKLDLRNNEIGRLNQDLNDIVEGLNQMASFANQIKQGNLGADYKPLSKNDVLGNALLEMKDSLREAAQREQERKIEDSKRNWISEGLAKFSNILRQNNDNIQDLAYTVTRQMVDYVEALQGAVFIFNDDGNDPYLELLVAYAYNERKHLTRRVPYGDGLVGTCAKEKAPIILTEIPDNYMLISSGLGQTIPKDILLMPMLVNDKIFGVIELAALKSFEQYKVEFVEQLGENFAATLANVKINERTNRLLQTTQEQANEMKKQESEMRQNLEELRATQERVANQDAETSSILQVLDKAAMVAQFKLSGTLIKANEQFANFFNKSVSEILGRSSKYFTNITEKHLDVYNAFWNKLRNGETLDTEQFIRLDKEVKWYKGVFAPIKNAENETIKIICIAYDISELKQLEKEIKRIPSKIEKQVAQDYQEQIEQLNQTIETLKQKLNDNAND